MKPHVWGKKPHLKMFKGVWECFGQGVTTFGENKSTAYNNWVIYLFENSLTRLGRELEERQ